MLFPSNFYFRYIYTYIHILSHLSYLIYTFPHKKGGKIKGGVLLFTKLYYFCAQIKHYGK